MATLVQVRCLADYQGQVFQCGQGDVLEMSLATFQALDQKAPGHFELVAQGSVQTRAFDGPPRNTAMASGQTTKKGI